MREKIIFKGRLLKLAHKDIKLPNGYVAHFEIVKHPGAVLVIPFLTKDKIILLRQLRPVIGIYLYELPAGTLDKNEKPVTCAHREIIEETGYAAKKVTYLSYIYPVPGYSTEKIHIFKAEGLYKKDRIPEKDEIIEHFVLTKKEIKKLFKSGRIIDAKTISALSLCGWI